MNRTELERERELLLLEWSRLLSESERARERCRSIQARVAEIDTALQATPA
jgi:hypothetical protein